MKQLLILILSFFIFSCDKNEPKPFSEQHTEQEVLNALIGTWHPYRLAYDEEFKKIVYIRDSPCEQAYHVTFNADSTITTFAQCLDEYNKGIFNIEKKQKLNGEIDIKINYEGVIISLSPTASHVRGIILQNYTDSTLIFSGTSYQQGGQDITNLYSEFKRVK